MKPLKKGDFVSIGKEVGIVIFLEGERETPNDHLSIWYGETNEKGKPRYRTVPIDYRDKIEDIERYH